MTRTNVLTLRRWRELDPAEQARIMGRATATILDPKLLGQIGEIYADVAARGDQAVADATAKWDKATVPADHLLVSQADIDAAHASIDPALLDAIRVAIAQVRAFNEAQLASSPDWRRETRPGVVVGERHHPIPSAGLFVPCGKGSFPSVLVMIGVPALVAGVREITVVVPPVPGSDRVDPGVLATAKELGITRIVRANGPAGIAAVVLGTETIGRVAKVVGPGSPAVTAAQILAQLHGVGTNMLCGPSESLVLADDSADIVRLTADLLNEAEHGADSAALLVTDSLAVVEAVDAEMARQIAALPEQRAAYARSALSELGGAFLFDTMDEATAFAGDYAPEHMQIATRDPEATLAKLTYAGEVLLGQNSPVSAANFVIGVPATLPTGGFARINGGITARTFMTTASVASLTEDGLRSLAPATLALADHEGFPAHANALRIRGMG
ncbi:MAG TPA: histidinol dehydrogenase [Candidatus Limnocylindrales bacterium]